MNTKKIAKPNSSLKEQLEASLKDMQLGKTYISSCGTNKKGFCSKSKRKLTICSDCCSSQSKRWYKIGLGEANKSCANCTKLKKKLKLYERLIKFQENIKKKKYTRKDLKW